MTKLMRKQCRGNNKEKCKKHFTKQSKLGWGGWDSALWRRTNKIQSVEYKRSAKSLGHHDVL